MSAAKTAGFIILAYIVFTTMKGNLRRWLEVIGLRPEMTPGVSLGGLSGTPLKPFFKIKPGASPQSTW